MTIHRKVKWLSAIFAILCVVNGATAQVVDPAYIPLAQEQVTGVLTRIQMARLPNGQILAFVEISGQIFVQKLNSDGTEDFSLHCSVCTFPVHRVASQPDGKMYLSGEGSSFPRARVVRLNADGSHDTSFSNALGATFPNREAMNVRAVAPDGKIYATIHDIPANSSYLYRLNADGSIDNTFTPTVFPAPANYVIGIVLQADDKVLIVGKHPSYGTYLFRLNSDGSDDTGFASPVLTGATPEAPIGINSAVVQPDGKIVIGGTFTKINGENRNCIARLNSDGSLDSAVSTVPLFQFTGGADIKAQSHGKIIVKGEGLDGRNFRRINPDLSTDPGFTADFDASSAANDWIIDSADRIIYLNNSRQLRRLNAEGTLDNTFTHGFPYKASHRTSAVAIQGDDKVIVAGDFTLIHGTAHRTISRLNTSGFPDLSFSTGTGFLNSSSNPAPPTQIIVQPDGKILALGPFTSYNGLGQARLARLNANGSLDTSFDPVITTNLISMALQADGNVLITGGGFAINGIGRTGVARLNSDGSLDSSFNPVITGGDSWNVSTVVPGPDGKIAIGGRFTSVNSVGRSNIARLNSDGTLDAAFAPALAGTFSIGPVFLGPDGKYMVANQNPVTGDDTVLRRLNYDGTADPTFLQRTLSSYINKIVFEPNGAIVVGGQFVSPRPRLARLSSIGVLDTGYFPDGGNDAVTGLVQMTDKRIIVGGFFDIIGGVVRRGIARLTFSPMQTRTPFDFNGDGRADFSVTRPSDYYWHLLTNGPYVYTATHFGAPGDKVVPGDYDGDGKTDIAIWRPSNGEWWWKASSTGNIVSRQYGDSVDTPIPSDTDGDGKTDLVLVSPGGLWKGVNTDGGLIVWYLFSQPGDKPVIGDFDGDGKSDLAYFRPSNGTWYYNKSSSGTNLELGTVQWGLGSDIPAPADYDGDGITDVAVFRPSEGNWYVLQSGGGYIMVHFGATGDKPVPADYDGDGKADIAVYRPSHGFWYMLLTTGGYTGLPWGISSDIPSQNALIPQPDPPRQVFVAPARADRPSRRR